MENYTRAFGDRDFLNSLIVSANYTVLAVVFAVSLGLGIALLPTFIAGPELRAGTLKSILPAYRAPELSVCALYPPTRHVSMKVRAFIDFLVAHFGDKPYWDAGV